MTFLLGLPDFMFVLEIMCNCHLSLKDTNKAVTLSPILSGVPQGSGLGPLLFFVHTSDMVVGLENKTVQYANDSTFVGVVKSPLMRNEAALSLNCDMKWIRE